MFILTGSNQFLLMESINQSLAGRVALIKLMPLSISELNHYYPSMEANSFLFNGFYPGIYANKRNPVKAYSDYYQTFVERDVHSLINIKDLSLFKKFIKLCAGRIGQIFNANNLSNEVGVSNKTISAWVSILEASYIIFLLPPWHDNISKRLIKSPKLYFYDVGLASFLLGNKTKEHIEFHPLRGNIFENMIILEFMKQTYNKGFDPDFYFYRDSNGNEIDLIIPDDPGIIPIEIKSAETFHTSLLKSNLFIGKLYQERVKNNYLIYTGNQEQTVNGVTLLNYKNTSIIV
jgi:predicted AAA+ superfamily ATPase